jgi:Tfp pilus assembly PilM family ATPase
MKSTSYIGVSFLKGKIQLAVVEHKRKKRTVTVLTERDTAIDFAQEGANLSATYPQLGTFVSELKSIIKQQKVTAEIISFALPPDPMFINIIPVDPALKGKDLSQYLQWEMNQYFPDASPKEFIIGADGLPLENKTAQQTFMVAVRRGVAAFLQKAVAGLKLNLNIIDVDQFSTEKTLITNYPEILDHEIVLFGLRKNGVDASLIHKGAMTDYRAFLYNGDSDPTKPIMEYLKYLKQKDIDTPAAILLHGIDIAQDFVVSLRSTTGIKQTLAMNSFRKIRAADKLSKPFMKESYRFAAAIGLALRTK